MTEAAGKKIKKVNIREIFKEKNPKVARMIPGFIYKYLERIAHQDEVNYFMGKYGDRIGIDFIEAAMKEYKVSLEVQGEENIPKSGRFVFVSNHPLGGFDGLLIIKAVCKFLSPVKFLVNDILMNVTNLTPLFIPINKHGRQAMEAAREIENTYDSDTQVLTFPAGLVSRKIKGQIVDLTWQKSFIVKAVKYQRDVIPIHMSGKCTKFFYRLANLRKTLGIKANIEMLYLVDETYHHKNKHFVIKVGKPIPWQTFDNTKQPLEWAKWVKEQVYKLDGVSSVPF
ncbi:MAG: 1-acyl-sn-glycerol-3-phosphate acyltransferase [Bacteroidales bacterium]|nr:1-acyl-sn-glycerol-3-phosphate acyltransferase [Bacteroidales bacterium]MBN2817965.1 1-acyl-sn-glycerol-3-phosphate acyltransferase [Bacteroidales bacterium]